MSSPCLRELWQGRGRKKANGMSMEEARHGLSTARLARCRSCLSRAWMVELQTGKSPAGIHGSDVRPSAVVTLQFVMVEKVVSLVARRHAIP